MSSISTLCCESYTNSPDRPEMRASLYQQGPPPIYQGHQRNESAQHQIDHSWHESSRTNTVSHKAVPEQPDEIIQTLARHQHNSHIASRANPSTTRMQQPNSSHVAQPSVPLDTAASALNGNKSATTEKVRLNCKLDSQTIKVWLEFDLHAGKFIANIRKEFKIRKLNLVQAATTLVLKSKEHGLDEHDCYMRLEEDDLEADWDEHVEWLKMRDPSCILGVFQIEND